MSKPLKLPPGATVRKFDRSKLPKSAREDACESELERRLFAHCEMFAKAKGLPVPVRQFVFEPDRKRGRPLDLAFPDRMVGVEVQGGTYSRERGGHSRGAGQSRDFDKLNSAARDGWLILQFDAKALEPPRIMQAVELIYATLAAAQIRRAVTHQVKE